MIELACPACRGGLESVDDGYGCPSCGGRYPVIDGIGRFLPPARAGEFASFLREYTTVRLAEGRGSDDPAYFRSLPRPTVSGPLDDQWRMRDHTWSVVQRRVLPPSPPSLVVADIGAGMGWLSNRLAELGHCPLAVDLTVDPSDGLGAVHHYETRFDCFQAEMDALPFADGTVELVIYNASLHYSVDLSVTLREALRVLVPAGRIVVMDSPLYRRAVDGAAMVAERHADFELRFGTRSDSIPSVGYLTPALLAEAGRTLGLQWKRHRPWYGWRWAWKPWRARLRRRRAPSRFELLVAQRTA